MNPEQKWATRGPVLHVHVIAAVLFGVAPACADSEPTAAEPSTPGSMQMAPVDEVDEEGEAKLELTVEGRSEPMQAQARLSVVEGTREVTFTITGGDAADNLVVIGLAFDGVGAVIGAHTVELGPPEADGPYAIASFEGQLYHSPSGEVELSLSREGSIEGSFDVALLQTSPSEVATPIDAMSGAFTGSWILHCQSPIPGFTGGHVVSDSPYCNNLEL
jgi:hypothetical protein